MGVTLLLARGLGENHHFSNLNENGQGPDRLCPWVAG